MELLAQVAGPAPPVDAGGRPHRRHVLDCRDRGPLREQLWDGHRPEAGDARAVDRDPRLRLGRARARVQLQLDPGRRHQQELAARHRRIERLKEESVDEEAGGERRRRRPRVQVLPFDVVADRDVGRRDRLLACDLLRLARRPVALVRAQGQDLGACRHRDLGPLVDRVLAVDADDLVGQRHHRAAREDPHDRAVEHHDGGRGVAHRRRLEGADDRAPLDAELVERQRHTERAGRPLHLETSGRAASSAAMVSRAAVACPAAACPSARRSRRWGSWGSRPTSRASSASASSCRPIADSTIASRWRGRPARDRGAAPCAARRRRPRCRRAPAGAPPAPPRCRHTRASADSSRASCSRARRSWARRRSASMTGHGTSSRWVPSLTSAGVAGRRLDGASGVEVEPARGERARQQQLRRPPSGGGARGRPGRLDRVARAFVLQRQRGEIVPGTRQVGIDGDGGAQRAAGGVARDVRGSRRIVVGHRTREREAQGKPRPGAEPADRGERVVRRLDPLGDRRRAVVGERSGRRRFAPAARGGQQVEREAGNARPGREAELDLVPAGAERHARGRKAGAIGGRGSMRARRPVADAETRLAGVVESDIVRAGRPIDRHAHEARPTSAVRGRGKIDAAARRRDGPPVPRAAARRRRQIRAGERSDQPVVDHLVTQPDVRATREIASASPSSAPRGRPDAPARRAPARASRSRRQFQRRQPSHRRRAVVPISSNSVSRRARRDGRDSGPSRLPRPAPPAARSAWRHSLRSRPPKRPVRNRCSRARTTRSDRRCGARADRPIKKRRGVRRGGLRPAPATPPARPRRPSAPAARAAWRTRPPPRPRRRRRSNRRRPASRAHRPGRGHADRACQRGVDLDQERPELG